MILKAEPVVAQHKKVKLNRVRTQVDFTQQQLADAANVRKRVLQRAEAGQYIRQINAWRILNTLNDERKRRGLSELAFEDIDWNIQGET